MRTFLLLLLISCSSQAAVEITKAIDKNVRISLFSPKEYQVSQRNKNNWKTK